jgi:hypothetical protein
MGRATDRSTERRHHHWQNVSTNRSVDRSRDDRTKTRDLNDENANYRDMNEDEATTNGEDNTSDMNSSSDDDDEGDDLDERGSVHRNDNLGEDVIGDENPLKKIVVDAVMSALRIMKEGGTSIRTFEDILEYGKNLLLAGNINEGIDRDVLLTLWPKNWANVQKLLQDEGYEDAKEYFICFCREEKKTTRNGKTTTKLVYSGKYSLMENKNDSCKHCGNRGYLKYYYLGLKAKVKNWFRDPDMCRKMLSHWNERAHWLGRTESYDNKSELWHGERWVELQWFWDPNTIWVLPTLCPLCGIPVSADHLTNSQDCPDGSKEVECQGCFEVFNHFIKTTHGSPLNLALIGHWDGWQPFGTSNKGCGSFEVSIGNMTKNDRNHVEEVFVIGFVPSYKVPNLPESFDPFLEPLMKDICTAFICGYQINYPKDVTVQDFEVSGEEIVRLLIICWTGDHPGQCEIGKFLNQGKCACRRCKLTGQQLSNSSNTHCYYGNNRYHFRYPLEKRSIEETVHDLFDIDNETRSSVRKTMASNTGFTGTSILHTYLYPLYKFDIMVHMVYDSFHTICLNVVKNQLERLLDLEVLDQTNLDKQIESFPWTKELKDGRIPAATKKFKGLGQWKAEGLQKFSFPMADCILKAHFDNLSSKELEIQSMISRLTELHFYGGRNGWTGDMIEYHRKLAWRLNIEVEEVQGLHMCTISLHNLMHLHEDVINFSTSDNYWCAVFERAVKQYVKKSHNCKGIEVTFAHSELRREFLKPLQIKAQVSRGKIYPGVVSIIYAFLKLSLVLQRIIQSRQLNSP